MKKYLLMFTIVAMASTSLFARDKQDRPTRDRTAGATYSQDNQTRSHRSSRHHHRRRRHHVTHTDQQR